MADTYDEIIAGLRADLATKSRDLADRESRITELEGDLAQALEDQTPLKDAAFVASQDAESIKRDCAAMMKFANQRIEELKSALAEREAECERLRKQRDEADDTANLRLRQIQNTLEALKAAGMPTKMDGYSPGSITRHIKHLRDSVAGQQKRADKIGWEFDRLQDDWLKSVAERDTLRAQLLESQQDLREEEKRHRKAAVDRDEFAAKLHLADQDRQILSDCRAALRDILGEEHC